MKAICIFCGSRPGVRPAYKMAAENMGKLLAAKGITIVYGGGNVGLMGILADAAREAGGEVIGVIPQFLVNKEVAHTGLSKLHVVKSMHERKALMANLSDGFIAMPGGFGTFEEFCEVITWSQLGLHQKPHGLLNVEGYYNPLIQFFDHAMAEQFLTPTLRSLVLEADTPEALLNLMAHYTTPTTFPQSAQTETQL